jgi:hypothetical protein
MYRFVPTAGSERGRIGAECETEGQVSQFKIADRTGKQAGRTVAEGFSSLTADFDTVARPFRVNSKKLSNQSKTILLFTPLHIFMST